jgi:DNA polymerase gamma 1
MISSTLHKRIFGQFVNNDNDIDNQLKINEINDHLRAHGLKPKSKKRKYNIINDIDIEKHLPQLFGDNLSQHFQILGNKYSNSYKELAFNLINTKLVEAPKQWIFREGWTRYTIDSNGVYVNQKVEFPLENDLVFDVEVCMNDSDGQKPTLATAVSSKAWYSWCSKRLVDCCDHKNINQLGFNSKSTLNDLIPMGLSVNSEKLIIGHNVSFDRSYIREQYNISCDKTRFLDTLSIHMCISGLTQHQRALSYSKKSKDIDELTDESVLTNEKNSFGVISPEMWDGVGSLNNLIDVYGLYCDKEETITKDPRNIFIKGSINDVFDNFQELMTYCATDVRITHQIFKTIFPLYLERFPHPITLAGMLEMSVMYLPIIINNWERYVSESQSIFNDQERELNLSLREIAYNACSLAKDNQYQNDVWLWDLDWRTQNIRFKKKKIEKPKKNKNNETIDENEVILDDKNEKIDNSLVTQSVAKVLASSSLLKKVQPLMPGYPRWFAEFCGKPKYEYNDSINQEDIEWEPGPYRISTQMRSVPKLMRLLWDGYPIHFDEKHGWGYLMPDLTANFSDDRVPGGVDDQKNTIYFPLSELKKIVDKRRFSKRVMDPSKIDDSFFRGYEELELEFEAEKTAALKDVIHGCLFRKLPHKGGPDKRVGNPLGKVLKLYFLIIRSHALNSTSK